MEGKVRWQAFMEGQTLWQAMLSSPLNPNLTRINCKQKNHEFLL